MRFSKQSPEPIGLACGGWPAATARAGLGAGGYAGCSMVACRLRILQHQEYGPSICGATLTRASWEETIPQDASSHTLLPRPARLHKRSTELRLAFLPDCSLAIGGHLHSAMSCTLEFCLQTGFMHHYKGSPSDFVSL